MKTKNEMREKKDWNKKEYKNELEKMEGNASLKSFLLKESIFNSYRASERTPDWQASTAYKSWTRYPLRHVAPTRY